MLLKRNFGKTICIMFMLLSLFLSGTECYAEGTDCGRDLEIKPMYESAVSVKTRLNINSNGVAEMVCILEPEKGAKLDRVTFNMVIAKADGTIFFNKSFNASYESSSGRYVVNKTFKLTRRGNYQLRVSAQCYRDGKIVETIKAPTAKDTY